MKLRGSAVRFIMVSATVPNVQDVAAWVGADREGTPAQVFEVRGSFNSGVCVCALPTTSLGKNSARAKSHDSCTALNASESRMILFFREPWTLNCSGSYRNILPINQFSSFHRRGKVLAPFLLPHSLLTYSGRCLRDS